MSRKTPLAPPRSSLSDEADLGWWDRLCLRLQWARHGIVVALVTIAVPVLVALFFFLLNKEEEIDGAMAWAVAVVPLFTVVLVIQAIQRTAIAAQRRRLDARTERYVRRLERGIETVREQGTALGDQTVGLLAQTRKIEKAVLLIPDTDISAPFAPLLRSAEAAVAVAYTGDPHRLHLVAAVRHALACIVDIAYAYQRVLDPAPPAPLRVAVNVQYHLDADALAAMKRSARHALADRLRFTPYGQTLDALAGVLDIHTGLSACRCGPARHTPDRALDAIALPVVRVGPLDTALARWNAGEVPLLPGTPFAAALAPRGALHRYPRARDLVRWSERHPLLDRRVTAQLRQYLEAERDRICSFAAIPILPPGAGAGSPALAVLAIHSNRTGDFGSDRALADFRTSIRDFTDLLRRPLADLAPPPLTG